MVKGPRHITSPTALRTLHPLHSLAPLPGAENNNKPGVKLPATLNVGGERAPLTILEAVLKQTGVYAPMRKGRLSVFWGDQVRFCACVLYMVVWWWLCSSGVTYTHALMREPRWPSPPNPSAHLPSLLSFPPSPTNQPTTTAPKRQVFIPTVPVAAYAPTHHVDILCALGPMPSASEWAEKGLDKYGLIAVNASGEAAQVGRWVHLFVCGDWGCVWMG